MFLRHDSLFFIFCFIVNYLLLQKSKKMICKKMRRTFAENREDDLQKMCVAK